MLVEGQKLQLTGWGFLDAALSNEISNICFSYFQIFHITFNLKSVIHIGTIQIDKNLLNYFICVAKKPTTLQHIELSPMNDEKCVDFHEYYIDGMYDDPDFYEEGLFCAGGEAGKDACEGDSGSAIFVNDNITGKAVQIGLVSGGVAEECGHEDAPSYYTRVSYYLKWILDNLD